MSEIEDVERIAAIDWATADEPAVTRGLTDVRRHRGWLDSIEVAAARRLAELAETSPSMFPERVAADAGRVSLAEASKGFDRAKTTTAIPQMGSALEQGETSGGHIDVVTRAMRQLTLDQRGHLADRGDMLALAASQLSRDEFGRVVRSELRRIKPTTASTVCNSSAATPGCVRGSIATQACGVCEASSTPKLAPSSRAASATRSSRCFTITNPIRARLILWRSRITFVLLALVALTTGSGAPVVGANRHVGAHRRRNAPVR